MECQDLFSLKSKKNILTCSLLQVLLGTLTVNIHDYREGPYKPAYPFSTVRTFLTIWMHPLICVFSVYTYTGLITNDLTDIYEHSNGSVI